MLPKSKKQPLKLSYDNIVVGSSLEAVLFAHQINAPLICTKIQKPYFFEEMEDFGIGTNKLDAWNKYIFILGIGGLFPFADKVKLLRYIDANTIKAITWEETVVDIKFNKLFLFSDESFYDLPIQPTKSNNDIIMVDWLKVKSGRYHDYQFIDRESKFINKLIFYAGSNKYGDKQSKDCLVISYLKENEQHYSKYAEYVVKIKTEKILEESGIKQNSILKIEVEHLQRDIIPINGNSYEMFDNVIPMIGVEPKTAWQFKKLRFKITYLQYIQKKLGL